MVIHIFDIENRLVGAFDWCFSGWPSWSYSNSLVPSAGNFPNWLVVGIAYPSEKSWSEFVSWDDFPCPIWMGKIIQPCSSHHQPETPLTQDFPAMFDDIRVYCQKIPCYNIISLMILKQTSSINNSHYDPIVVIGSTSLWFYLLMDECNPIISSINDHYIPNIPIQTKTIVYSPNAEFFLHNHYW